MSCKSSPWFFLEEKLTIPTASFNQCPSKIEKYFYKILNINTYGVINIIELLQAIDR